MASRKRKSARASVAAAPRLAAGDASDVIARGSRICGDALETLETCIERLRVLIGNEDNYDKDLVSHLAWLTVQVVPIMNELRQQAKQALREVSKIPLDTIIAYLKTLPDEARDGVVRDLTGADAEEPLL